MTTREQLLKHIQQTKQQKGYFGGDGWGKDFELFVDLGVVWWGRKIWKVPADILCLFDIANCDNKQ